MWMFPKIVGFSHQIIHFIIRFSIVNHPFWGIPIFGNTHMYPLEKTMSIFWLFLKSDENSGFPKLQDAHGDWCHATPRGDTASRLGGWVVEWHGESLKVLLVFPYKFTLIFFGSEVELLSIWPQNVHQILNGDEGYLGHMGLPRRPSTC